MKLVFDFDDTVFDSERFKNEKFFNCLEDYGVTPKELKESYSAYRDLHTIYDIHLHINEVFRERSIEASVEDVVFTMVQNIEEYVFPAYKEVFRQYDRENIFILTQGSEHFQNLKVRHSRVEEQVEKVFIVPGNKQEVLNEMALLWPNETILFFDDRFENMKFEKSESSIVRVFVGNTELLTNTEREYLEKNRIFTSSIDAIPRSIPQFLKDANVEQSELIRNSERIGRVI